MGPANDTTSTNEDQLRWRIPCVGPNGESREATVLVLGDRIALVLPHGNTLIFDAAEARDFAQALEQVEQHLSEQPAPGSE